MQANVGGADRVIRFVIGLALLSLIFILDGNARWWGLLGLVPLLTASIRICPLYSVFGINSCPLSKRG